MRSRILRSVAEGRSQGYFNFVAEQATNRLSHCGTGLVTVGVHSQKRVKAELLDRDWIAIWIGGCETRLDSGSQVEFGADKLQLRVD
jgi:hypothetical protein